MIIMMMISEASADHDTFRLMMIFYEWFHHHGWYIMVILDPVAVGSLCPYDRGNLLFALM